MHTFTSRRPTCCAVVLLASVCLTATASDEGWYAPSPDSPPIAPAPHVAPDPYAARGRERIAHGDGVTFGAAFGAPDADGGLSGRGFVARLRTGERSPERTRSAAIGSGPPHLVSIDSVPSPLPGLSSHRFLAARLSPGRSRAFPSEPASTPTPVARPDRASHWTTIPLLGAARGSTTAPDPSPPASAAYGPWLDGQGPSSNARQLLARLEQVDTHGLRAADYDLAGLHGALAALFGREPPRIAPSDALAARAALDARFDAAFTALATDLGRGVVAGRRVQSRLFRDRLAPDAAQLLGALGRGETDVDTALGSVAVSHPHYARLRARMRELLEERASGVPRVAVGGDEELRPGQRHRDIMGVKARLIEVGELERRTVLTPVFDADLVLAIERFQRRHGIEPLPRIGPRTREALARTVEQDIDDVALSLERWRWLPRELGARHVFVNLPDYRLQLFENGRTLADMPVVIGAKRFPTPSFSRDMSYLEFNPTWTVPASITNRELIPLERRDPGYLASRRFDFLELVDGRLEKVARETVTPEDFETTPFPYTLRQRGGAGNALGRMKFMMPNRYAIYLHDTPSKRHFALHERAYSHGCVRLGDPDRLADVLMRKDGKSTGEIARALANPLTNRVRLKTHVPTHLVYLTTWVDESGTVQRRPDVYGYDPALREALLGKGLLPSAYPSAPASGHVRRGATLSGLAAPVSTTSEPG